MCKWIDGGQIKDMYIEIYGRKERVYALLTQT